MVICKNLVPARLRWSRSISSGFPVPARSNRHSHQSPRVDYEKLRGDRLGNRGHSFVRVYQLHGKFNRSGLPITNLLIPNRPILSVDMRVGEIRHCCRLPNDGQLLMRAAMSQLNLSARAYHRLLKLACTIADPASCEEIQSVHSAEALQYRPKLMLG